MQLMPGEMLLAQLANVTLTNYRVQGEISRWGERKLTTIGLDDLTSCDIESHSKPAFIVVGVLLGIIALRWYSGLLVIALGCVALWFFTRTRAMVLRSASERISVSRSGVGESWKELQDFVHRVQLAKADRATASRAGSMAAALRAQDQPQYQAPRSLQPPAVPQVRADTQPLEPVRPQLSQAHIWTGQPSFTFGHEAFAAAAVPPTALQDSNPKQEATTPEETSPPTQLPDAPKEPALSVEESGIAAVAVAADCLPTKPQVGQPSIVATAADRQGKPYSGSTLALGIGGAAVVAVAIVLAVLNYSRTQPQPSTVQSQQPVGPAEEEAIARTLNSWVESFRMKDSAVHVGCYAPVVETYFRKHNVINAQLSSDKLKAFSDIAEVRKYEIRDIRFTRAEDGRVAVTFRKDWDTVSVAGDAFAGSEVGKLTFASYQEGWKIVREEELKILRVTRTKPGQQ